MAINQLHHERIDKVELYGLFDPDSGDLRYIGKADSAAKRFKTHLWDSRTASRPVCRWIKALLAEGKTPRIEVLETVNRADWEQAERRLIGLHRKTAKLLNLADGGNRPSQTKGQRVKAAKASLKAQAQNPAMAEFNKAKMDMGRLYQQLCRKPDINTYVLRLRMKCYAAYRPDLHKSWVNLP